MNRSLPPRFVTARAIQRSKKGSRTWPSASQSWVCSWASPILVKGDSERQKMVPRTCTRSTTFNTYSSCSKLHEAIISRGSLLQWVSQPRGTGVQHLLRMEVQRIVLEK